LLTNNIDRSFSIGEPSGRSAGKVDPIGKVVGSSQRLELVIVAVIHQRVPKNEVAWYLRLCLCHAPHIQQQYNPTHNPHFLQLPGHSRNIGKPRKRKEKRGSIKGMVRNLNATGNVYIEGRDEEKIGQCFCFYS
jgi:hypothetical protein